MSSSFKETSADITVRLVIRYDKNKPNYGYIDPDRPEIDKSRIQKEISNIGLPYCRNDAIIVPRVGSVQIQWYFPKHSKVPLNIAQKLQTEPDSVREREISAWLKQNQIFKITVTCKERGRSPTLIAKYPNQAYSNDFEMFSLPSNKESYKYLSSSSKSQAESDVGYQRYPAPTRVWGAKPDSAASASSTEVKLGRYSLSVNMNDDETSDRRGARTSSTAPRSPRITPIKIEPDSPRTGRGVDSHRSDSFFGSKILSRSPERASRWDIVKDTSNPFPSLTPIKRRYDSRSPSPSGARRALDDIGRSVRPRLDKEKGSTRRSSRSRSRRSESVIGSDLHGHSSSSYERSAKRSSPSSASLKTPTGPRSDRQDHSESPYVSSLASARIAVPTTAGTKLSSVGVPPNKSVDENKDKSSLGSLTSLSSSTLTALLSSLRSSREVTGAGESSSLPSAATPSLPPTSTVWNTGVTQSSLSSFWQPASNLQQPTSSAVPVGSTAPSSSVATTSVVPAPIAAPGAGAHGQMSFEPYAGYTYPYGYPLYPYHPYPFLQPATIANAATSSTGLTEVSVVESKTETDIVESATRVKFEHMDTSSSSIKDIGENIVDSNLNSIPTSSNPNHSRNGGDVTPPSPSSQRMISLRTELLKLREESRERVKREQVILAELADLNEKRKTDFVLGEVDSRELEEIVDGTRLALEDESSDEPMVPELNAIETELQSNVLILQAQLKSEQTARRSADQDRRDAEFAKREAECRKEEAEQGRATAERSLRELEKQLGDAEKSIRELAHAKKEAEIGLREAIERKRDADQLRRDADHARRDADDRRKDAEKAKRDAVKARHEAEDRRSEAEQAKRDIESAKRRAESDRRDSDDKRRAAEQERRDAEYAKREMEKRWKEAELARREADERRWEAEAIVADVQRECKTPFLVPALMEAFVNVSRLTTRTGKAATLTVGVDGGSAGASASALGEENKNE